VVMPLREGLISFFGGALGCSRDTTIAKYTGQTLLQIHANMGVSVPVFNRFNEILIGVLNTDGVSLEDQALVLSVLQSTSSQIVSVCNRYSSALSLTNAQLVGYVVDQALSALTTNVITAPYFNGMTPVGSTNFTNSSNSAQLTDLRNSLVSFFGGALGCSDGTITPYMGPSMYDVHKNLRISGIAFDSFKTVIMRIASKAGVTADDVTEIGAILETLRTAIVFVPTTICDRYSDILHIDDYTLVSSIVQGTVKAVVSDNHLRPYFDGSRIRFSTNFLENSVALADLETKLIEFFGAALQCSDQTIPPYRSRDLFTTHRNMRIDADDFARFNSHLINTMANAGVSSADLAAVNSFLNGTQSDVVSNQDYVQNDFAPTTANYQMITAVSVMGVFGAILLAVVLVGLTLVSDKIKINY